MKRTMVLPLAALTALRLTALPQALTPTPKFHDSWWKSQYERNLAWVRTFDFDFVFLGDSLMNRWEYEPAGLRVWARRLADYRILNAAIAGDCTENVLWRLEHGALDGVTPRAVFLLIGTNNAGLRPPECETPEDTAAGIRTIVAYLRMKVPEATIVLHPILLRGRTSDDPVRRRNERVNALIRPLADDTHVIWMDMRKLFAEQNGTVSPDVMKDGLHLTSDRAYDMWADAITPLLDVFLQCKTSSRPRIWRCSGSSSDNRTLPSRRTGELELRFRETAKGRRLFLTMPDGTTFAWTAGEERPEPADYLFASRGRTHRLSRRTASGQTVDESPCVGSAAQVVPRTRTEGLEIRLVACGGRYWMGQGGTVCDALRDHISFSGDKGYDTETFSAAWLIRFGRFAAFFGGDVHGFLTDHEGKWYSYEGRLGQIVGPVDVCLVNGGGRKGTADATFVSCTHPAVWLTGVSGDECLHDDVLTSLLSRVRYPAERYVFSTDMVPSSLERLAAHPGWKELVMSGDEIVVRVAAGGATYHVFALLGNSIQAVFEGRVLGERK